MMKENLLLLKHLLDSYKHMTSISKNLYIDKLDDSYNNTYHSAIKMNPADVKSSTYIDSSKDINDEDSKFKIFDISRTSKYETIYVPNWSEEVFVIKNIKNTVPWTYVISDFKGEEIVGTFYEKELQKTNQKEFRVEKVTKRKGNKLFVKWKAFLTVGLIKKP